MAKLTLNMIEPQNDNVFVVNTATVLIGDGSDVAEIIITTDAPFDGMESAEITAELIEYFEGLVGTLRGAQNG